MARLPRGTIGGRTGAPSGASTERSGFWSGVREQLFEFAEASGNDTFVNDILRRMDEQDEIVKRDITAAVSKEFSRALAQVGSELERFKGKAEGLRGVDSAFGRMGGSVNDVGLRISALGQSMMATNRAVRALTGLGMAAAFTSFARSLDTMARNTISVHYFAIESRLTVQEIDRLRQAGERLAVATPSVDRAVATMAQRLADFNSKGTYSEFGQMLEGMGTYARTVFGPQLLNIYRTEGIVPAQRFMLRKAGELMRSPRPEDQEAARHLLAGMGDVPTAFIDLFEAYEKDIPRERLVTPDKAKEFHDAWVNIGATLGNVWERVQASAIDVVLGITAEMAKNFTPEAQKAFVTALEGIETSIKNINWEAAADGVYSFGESVIRVIYGVAEAERYRARVQARKEEAPPPTNQPRIQLQSFEEDGGLEFGAGQGGGRFPAPFNVRRSSPSLIQPASLFVPPDGGYEGRPPAVSGDGAPTGPAVPVLRLWAGEARRWLPSSGTAETGEELAAGSSAPRHKPRQGREGDASKISFGTLAGFEEQERMHKLVDVERGSNVLLADIRDTLRLMDDLGDGGDGGGKGGLGGYARWRRGQRGGAGGPGGPGGGGGPIGRFTGQKGERAERWRRWTAAVKGGSPGDPRNMAAFIREEAIRQGIDPNIALRVARSEGLGNPVAGVPSEQSYSAFQLNMVRSGVGDIMLRQTGIDPSLPENEKAAIAFTLRYVRQHGWGPWVGARKQGITGRAGVGAGGYEPDYRSLVMAAQERQAALSGGASSSTINYTRISGRVGDPRPGRVHLGTDYVAPAGTPFRARFSGVVERLGTLGDIYVRNDDGSQSVYRHVVPGVRAGQRVLSGHTIGSLRRYDPRSTGPHLHEEYRDPSGRIRRTTELDEARRRAGKAEASRKKMDRAAAEESKPAPKPRPLNLNVRIKAGAGIKTKVDTTDNIETKVERRGMVD